MANSILRLPVVKARTGLSRSTIYQRVAEGDFPKPINLGARAVGWLEVMAMKGGLRPEDGELAGAVVESEGDRFPAAGPAADHRQEKTGGGNQWGGNTPCHKHP